MEVVNNKKLSRFEIALPGGEFAILEYRWLKGSMVVMHTMVPTSARGQGLADSLAKYALEYIREQNLKTIVYCPFVTKYMEKHPEYNDLLENK